MSRPLVRLLVVLTCVAVVDVAAVAQHQLVLGIAVTPGLLVVPTLVGLAFGGLVVALWELRRRERSLREAVATREAELLALNAELEERVSHRVDELRDREAQLAEARRWGTVGRLAAGVAHDLGNLLLSLEGFVEDLPDEDRAALRDVLEQGRSLTRSLVAVGGRPPETLPDLPVRAAVAEALPALRAMLPDGLSLDLQGEPADGPVVPFHPLALRRILQNLVLNAAQAMPGGGRVTLAVSGDDDDAVIEVMDRGHGVPDDLLDRLYEPFVTGRRDQGGTGLGLAVVQGLVTQVGGSIALRPRDGGGTIAVVRLPGHARVVRSVDPDPLLEQDSVVP